MFEELKPLVVAMLLRENWGAQKIKEVLEASGNLAGDTRGGMKNVVIVMQGRIGDEIGLLLERARKSIQMMQTMGVRIVLYTDKEFPLQLNEISDGPVCLFALGNIKLLNAKLITVVGTRRPSEYGQRIVKEMFNGISEFDKEKKKVVFVSGLAYGVDSLVHKVALDNGLGTIAVVPGAIGAGFPEANRGLYDRILKEDGLVIAEFPYGRRLFKGMFPMRNRILAALGEETVVVEAGKDSGAMITAKYVIKYGRPVLSFPYNLWSENGLGCIELAQSGSKVIWSQKELIDELSLVKKDKVSSPLESYLKADSDICGIYSNVKKQERQVLVFLREYLINKSSFTQEEFVAFLTVKYSEGQAEEKLAEKKKFEACEISTILTKLELEGILRRKGNYYEQFSIS